MSQYIKNVKVIGIHRRFDINLSFYNDINIIHGRNGTGKTTLLHILANAVNGKFERFGYLKFSDIQIIFDDDRKIRIKQTMDENPENLKTSVWLDKARKPIYSITLKDLIKQEMEKSNAKIRNIRNYLAPNKSNSSQTNFQQKIGLQATYFPAFRTMIEAWAKFNEQEISLIFNRSISSIERRLSPKVAISKEIRELFENSPTEMARGLFGDFVSELNYPSLLEIEEKINTELLDAQLTVANSDIDLLSDAFVKAFAAISQESDLDNITEEPEEILKNIGKLSDRLQNFPLHTGVDQANTIYAKLKNQLKSFKLEFESQNIAKKVLSVYQNSLQKRLDEQMSAYANIEKYLESVNNFLEKKQLFIEPHANKGRAKLRVKIGDEPSSHSLQILSSGERQIVGLIYAASHMINGSVVLIDEPEISLHVDWQRKLLPEMLNQLPEKQLIVCTHSPTIASRYREKMIELKLEPTSEIDIQKAIELEVFDENSF